MFREKRYDIIKSYSKEEIEAFYNSYMHNISLGLFETRYLHPNEIILNMDKEREWEPIAKKDGYLYEYQDNRIALAEDILENGNYFPLWCFEEDGKHMGSEGIHRLDSMQMAYREGLWKDEKVFTIIMRKEFDVLEKNYQVHQLEEPIDIYVPIYNIENGWYEKRFGWKYQRFDNKSVLENAKEDGNVIIRIDTEEEYFNTCKIYHKLLRHCFYRYKTNNNDYIKPRFELK